MTVSRLALSRANCSRIGASPRQVGQCGAQNHSSSGLSPVTSDTSRTPLPVATSTISKSGTSADTATAPELSSVPSPPEPSVAAASPLPVSPPPASEAAAVSAGAVVGLESVPPAAGAEELPSASAPSVADPPPQAAATSPTATSPPAKSQRRRLDRRARAGRMPTTAGDRAASGYRPIDAEPTGPVGCRTGLGSSLVGAFDRLNLYHGGRQLCGRGRPGWRWLDLRLLCERLLAERRDWGEQRPLLHRVVYCTAFIDGQINEAGRRRQGAYVRALRAHGCFDHLEEGKFVARTRSGFLAVADRRGRPVATRSGWPVQVRDRRGRPVRDAQFMVSYLSLQEKGSDVNVATHCSRTCWVSEWMPPS